MALNNPQELICHSTPTNQPTYDYIFAKICIFGSLNVRNTCKRMFGFECICMCVCDFFFIVVFFGGRGGG